MAKYDASQIKVLENIPDLEELENGECRRTYLYRFINKLPEQNELDRIASSVSRKFTFSKELSELPEDVEIYASVTIERLQDYEAKVSIVTAFVWEERYVFVFGLYTLPRKLEEKFGTVELFQGQSRDTCPGFR